MSGQAQIYIGTSGWSYPKGEGTWNGYFYPPGKINKKSCQCLRANRKGSLKLSKIGPGPGRSAVENPPGIIIDPLGQDETGRHGPFP